MRKEDRLEDRAGRWINCGVRLGVMILSAMLISACGGGSSGSRGVPSLTFVSQAGGAGVDKGQGVATYADGSFVVSGFFGATATFGAGETNETTFTSDGEADAYVARYGVDGTLEFVKRVRGPGDIAAQDVATHSDGSFVATGMFRGDATFGDGESNETTLSSIDGFDVYVARHNADGTLAYVKQAGGLDNIFSFRSAMHMDGSFVVTGFFGGTVTFGEGEVNETSFTSGGSTDAYVARYNADGALAFATQLGGTGAELGVGIATFADGSFVMTGAYQNTVTLGAGEPNETVLTAEGDFDLLVVRFNADGTLAFATSAGGIASSVASGRSVVTRADGSFVMTGSFTDPVTFGVGEINETTLNSSGDSDLFVARYNANGTLAFARHGGGGGSGDGSVLTVLADDSFAVTGYFQGSAIFGVGQVNETTLTSDGGFDAYMARFHADGTLAYAKRVGGTGDVTAESIASHADGSIVVTGHFTGTMTFDHGEAGETMITSGGSADTFIVRYNAEGDL